MLFNSACSNKCIVVSVILETPAPKFLYEDRIAQIKSNEKNIHVIKHFFGDGSLKIDVSD